MVCRYGVCSLIYYFSSFLFVFWGRISILLLLKADELNVSIKTRCRWDIHKEPNSLAPKRDNTEDEDVTGGFQCFVHQQQNKTKIVYRKDKRDATLTKRQRMHTFAVMPCNIQVFYQSIHDLDRRFFQDMANALVDLIPTVYTITLCSFVQWIASQHCISWYAA